MLTLPIEVICGGILPYLSVCDLQALDTAYTTTYHRPQLRKAWAAYYYDTFDVGLKEHEVVWLCRIGVRIVSLTVSDSTLKSEFLKNFPTLKRLRLELSVLCDIVLNLAMNSPDLENLSVANVCGPDIDNAVSALAQNCRQLHTLRINSKELTDAGIFALAQYCSQLHTLHLGHVKITDAGIQALCDNCPHLKHIELSFCNNLTDASLIAIASTFSQLRNISMHSYNFTDDGLMYFADKCHELRSVSVRCDNITSRGLTALWAANPNLMDFDTGFNNFISDDDIIQLAQCCPLLQKLKLVYCRKITDAAVIAVAEHCPQLRSLNICNCREVSDASLIALGQHCHELKSIDISYLKNISDVGIAALAAGCPLLQEFYASGANITDADVVALACGCRDLREVELNYCLSVGGTAISAIAKNLPLLSLLSAEDCGHVDDACLYVIAQYCRNITYVNLSYTGVTVDALIAVVKSCRMLQYFICCDKKAVQKYAGPRLEIFAS